MGRLGIAALGLVLALEQSAYAQTSPQQPAKPAAEQKDDLTSLDVMDLAKMQVTSASKKAESLFGVAAAISVVTAEDIKRTGATNIPEALRLVPGVQVAQVNSNQYAVSIRGFNSLYSSQLLVLIDGRSIYNSFWGGVYWEDYAMSMDEIERIEVIRGPGGTLWGANAVNGVINIITKDAKNTKGASISAQAAPHGTFAAGTLRYGEALSHGDFRVTAYGLKAESSLNNAGTSNGDPENGSRFSFRYDGGSAETGKVLLEGDMHRYSIDMPNGTFTSTFPFETAGWGTYSNVGTSLLAKIEKSYSNGSSNSLQASYDHTYHFVDPELITRDGTIDIEFQHGFQPFGNNSVIAGASFRTTADDYTAAQTVVKPNAETTQVSSFFAQDQIQLSKTTKATIGTKVEHNDFSGWEVEPSARIAVQPDDKHTWWSSVSRAVSTPNRATSDFAWPLEQIPVPIGGGAYLPGQLTLMGDPKLPSTVMTAVESGYRLEVNSRTTAELSVFQNSYNHLKTYETLAAIPGNPVVIPWQEVDAGSSTVRGFELSGKIQATPKLRFDVGYAYEISDLPGGTFATPKHELKELATYTFNDKLSFDQAIYFAGGSSDGNASYHRMDLQLRYKPSKTCDFTIGGRNLGSGQYTQLGSGQFASGGLIKPTIYSQLTFKF